MILRQVLSKLDCLKSDINHKEVALRNRIVSTISSPLEIIYSFENATIILPNGIILHLEDVLSNSRSNRNLFSLNMYSIMSTLLRH